MPRRIKVAQLQQLPPGTILPLQLDALAVPLLLCNAQGRLFCVEDRCPHMALPLRGGSLIGEQILCPFHKARFDLNTGEALCFPASQPIRTFPVSTDEHNNVFIEFEPQPFRIDLLPF